VTPAEDGAKPAGLVIHARAVSKQFILRHNRNSSIKSRVLGLLHERQRETLEPFWALRDISIAIGRGERVGLVGRNGSGKSTLLKLIAGIHRPTSGQLLMARGAVVGTMIELGIGFHPDLTGTENVFLNAAIHGRSKEEIDEMYPKVVEYSGLDRFMDVALKNYSSGMHMRLGFAVAANLNPDIMLLDEVFAVGDEDFQKKCMKTMDGFAAEGRTIIFVSHMVSAVKAMCRRVCVLEAGRLHFDGDVERGLAEYHKLLRATSAAPAHEQQEMADLAAISRRVLSDWALTLLTAQGVEPHHRLVEIGIDPVPPPYVPLRAHVGAERYAYWQAAAPAPPLVDSADVVIAPSVFLHYSMNVIARTIGTALTHMPRGARFYGTFFETAGGVQAFQPTPWPGGFFTSSDSVPYQYSFDLINSLASAFGATAHRVTDVPHPNGETAFVIVKT
jgi:ABC-type polysaccharide/polyol phosphate transport system ATPase subunit